MQHDLGSALLRINSTLSLSLPCTQFPPDIMVAFSMLHFVGKVWASLNFPLKVTCYLLLLLLLLLLLPETWSSVYLWILLKLEHIPESINPYWFYLEYTILFQSVGSKVPWFQESSLKLNPTRFSILFSLLWKERLCIHCISFCFYINDFLLIYLAVSDPSCSMWDLSLWNTDSPVVLCKLWKALAQ